MDDSSVNTDDSSLNMDELKTTERDICVTTWLDYEANTYVY